jgi:hypothetical protein
VAAPLPFSESELRLLQVLLKRKVRFMVVGLSAATLQGAPVVTQDVDLWFENLGEQKISRALQEVGAAYVPPGNFNPPMLAGTGAELFNIVIRMDGLGTFANEIKNCVDRKNTAAKCHRSAGQNLHDRRRYAEVFYARCLDESVFRLFGRNRPGKR